MELSPRMREFRRVLMLLLHSPRREKTMRMASEGFVPHSLLCFSCQTLAVVAVRGAALWASLAGVRAENERGPTALACKDKQAQIGIPHILMRGLGGAGAVLPIATATRRAHS